MSKTIAILAVVAIAEALMIARMVLHPRYIIVSDKRQAVIVTNQFYWAFEFEAPDSKFQTLVRKVPQQMSYRNPMTGWSALEECAARKRTNAARILIAGGANVEEAISNEIKEHNVEDARFLESVKGETKHEVR